MATTLKTSIGNNTTDSLSQLQPGVLDLSHLPVTRLERMARAGQEILRWHDILHRSGDTVITSMLADAMQPTAWDHIPANDVVDNTSGSQFFFHLHGEEEDDGGNGHTDHRDIGETGHFHCFQRLKDPEGGMIRFEPVSAARGHAVAAPAQREDGTGIAHLVALGIDAFGLPNRLFTTNRWVTGETWCPAAELIPQIDAFEISHGQPNFIVNQWMTEMIRLFQPQIACLLMARDQMLKDHGGGKLSPALNDRSIEVTSELPISVPAQTAAVAAALEQNRS